ncbi:hypothetical protein BH10PSE13_BH10PSE13_21740 [soil metagenome]
MENDDLSQMVFAKINYSGNYFDEHAKVVTLIESFFSDVNSGLQSDSWIWIMDGDEKVAIDTFTSIKHQVKSYTAGLHVQKVIDALHTKYDVEVFDEPVGEWD